MSVPSFLIGYPTYTAPGIRFRAIYTPGLEPRLGGEVEIESSLNPASGKWTPMDIVYNLEARTPGGAWEIEVNCFKLPPQSSYSAPGAA